MTPWINHRAEISKCPVILVQVDPFSTLGTARVLPTGVCTEPFGFLETSGRRGRRIFRGVVASKRIQPRSRIRGAEQIPRQAKGPRSEPPATLAAEGQRGLEQLVHDEALAELGRRGHCDPQVDPQR